MEQGFYCVGQYALLPEGFSDFSEFRDWLMTQHFPLVVEAVCLHENNHDRSWPQEKGLCLAPYFLTGYADEPTYLTIPSPYAVYPAEVERMDQKTYNNRLRQIINEKCPGCTRFKPLSNRDISLNGHFTEMTLDGTCAFRCECKPFPRELREMMRYCLGSFRDYGAPEDYVPSAERVADAIKTWLYIKLNTCAADKLEDGRTCYTVSHKKDEFIDLVLMAFGEVIKYNAPDKYAIVDPGNKIPDQATVDRWLSPENREKFEKAAKKYGFGIGYLHYLRQAESPVWMTLRSFASEGLFYPLFRNDRGVCILICDIHRTLDRLRYHAPLLETCGTVIDVYSAYERSAYTVSREMEREEL